MSRSSRAAWPAALSVAFAAACADVTPPKAPSASERTGPGYLPGQVTDVPEVQVTLPPQPRPWDTNGQALVQAVAAGAGHAIVAFKEPGSVRVKESGFRAAVSSETIEAGVRLLGGLGVEITGYLRNLGAVAVRMDPSLAPEIAANILVDYVEPRQRAELAGVGAPAFLPQGSQVTPWGLNMIGAPWVWSTTTTGTGAKILVIDAPYFRGHEDLPSIPDPNCGNAGCSPGVISHGTFVLGEMAARDNAVGVVGGAKGVLDADVYFWAACNSFNGSCDTDALAQGIDQGVTWLVGVISMSLQGPYDLSIAEATQRAWNADIVLVAAAGNCFNNDGDTCDQPRYPGALPLVIGVSGVRSNGLFANTSPCVDPLYGIVTSRYGVWVDLAAPFWSRSAVNNGGYEDEQTNGSLWCGTSMATPFVSSTVALMRAKNPSVPNWQIRDILLANADDRGDPGWDVFYGNGIVRADWAVAAVPPVLQASIAGPNEVPPNYPCSWSAQVGGGDPPYTITWSGVLSGSGYTISGSLPQSGWLYLDVTDDSGHGEGDEMFIDVYMGAPECGLR